jgi:hypothetical protein
VQGEFKLEMEQARPRELSDSAERHSPDNFLSPSPDFLDWKILKETPKNGDVHIAFGNLSLRDTSGDIKRLTDQYSKFNSSSEAQERFTKRLTELSKTDHGKEFIETLSTAISKPPAEVGKILAGALVKELGQEFNGGNINFDRAQTQFGAIASMVTVLGGGDNSPGGTKESVVNAFNQEMGARFLREEKNITGTATDTAGKSYQASPMMVLYKETGRPPGMIPAPANEIIDTLHYVER